MYMALIFDSPTPDGASIDPATLFWLFTAFVVLVLVVILRHQHALKGGSSQSAPSKPADDDGADVLGPATSNDSFSNSNTNSLVSFNITNFQNSRTGAAAQAFHDVTRSSTNGSWAGGGGFGAGSGFRGFGGGASSGAGAGSGWEDAADVVTAVAEIASSFAGFGGGSSKGGGASGDY